MNSPSLVRRTEAAAPTFTLYHGPDRTEISTTEGPFHGIVPRALVGVVGLDDWRLYAHRFFDDATEENGSLALLRQAARQSHVLSFRHSAEAAQRFVERRLDLQEARCDLWNIKEGHTSSVWRVTVDGENASGEFILNVARDDAAGLELARTAWTMQAIGDCYPDLAMAKVEDIAEVEIDYFGQPAAVTVTRNELVRDALEIHLGRDRQTGEPTHVVVERFLMSPEQPSEIVHIFGRVMTHTECLRLEAGLAAFLDAALQVAPVALDINDGDIVWADSRAVVVAIR